MATKKKSAGTKADNPQDRGQIAQLASAIPDLEVGVLPPVLGSRVRIWKQDPSVSGISVRPVYIHTQVDDGPKDSQIEIRDLPMVSPDINGDFLFEPSSPEAFDSVHTYAIVRQTLTMYQRRLSRKLGWQWNQGGNTIPIAVFPHGGQGLNAFYSRSDRELRFFIGEQPGANGNKVFACRSLDIVAHEAGHAVLDALKPQWLGFFNPPQTGGLHESFGDLTAIFLILSQLDLVEYIIAQTKADLHRKNVLAEVAEELGSALGRSTGLRNADNDLKLSAVSSEVHDISKVFTGGIYNVLADAFSAARDPRNRDDAAVLYEVGQKLAGLTLQGLINSPDSAATYADVVGEMIKLAEDDAVEYPDYADFLRKHFEFREVIGDKAVTGPQVVTGMAAGRSGCCATMRRREYANET
jgi:hypothetical protein